MMVSKRGFYRVSCSMNTKSNDQIGTAMQGVSRECPYCHAITRFYFSARDINRNTTDDVFVYDQCTGCGLVFLRDPPEALAKYYAGGYQPIPNSLNELRALAQKEKYRLDPVLRFHHSGKLLELGPWIGIFSSNAKDSGFDVTAIDMDSRCVSFLKETLRIKAIASDDPVEAMDVLNEQFDVIVMWHCLEHFREPWTVIQRAADYLRPGGILLVAIPNIESFEFSILGSRWTHIDAPRHLYFPPLSLLNRMATACGLGLTDVTTTSDRLSWQLRRSSWQAWAQDLMPIRGLRRVFGAIVGRLCSVLVGRNRAGAGITAVFTKPVE